jgi:hypothetical protein
MDVVSHQHIGVKPKTVALAVPIVVKGSLALVAAHDDMAERAVKLDSGFSRHAGTVSAGLCECK